MNVTPKCHNYSTPFPTHDDISEISTLQASDKKKIIHWFNQLLNNELQYKNAGLCYITINTSFAPMPIISYTSSRCHLLHTNFLKEKGWTSSWLSATFPQKYVILSPCKQGKAHIFNQVQS